MKESTKRGIECVGLIVLTGVFAHLGSVRGDDPGQIPPTWDTGYRSYVGSPSIAVNTTVRTFQPSSASGGHPDFNRTSSSGPGRYMNILADELGLDGHPVFRTTGQRVIADWHDAAGNPISPPRPFIYPRPGDTAGRLDSSPGDAASSAASVAQWFRDVPGVNASSRAPLTMLYTGGRYLYDGSLDSMAGGNLNYTTELNFHFVNERNRNFYIAAETNAEIWIYVDGRLVIDGGGAGGATFNIVNGTVIPTEPADASVTIVGCAITNGGLPVPVTMSARVGSQTYEPFGNAGLPLLGNVNDNRNPRQALLASNMPAGTPISINGTSWLRDASGILNDYIGVSSTPASEQVKVLRNGDAVPDIRPFDNQATIQSYLQPYLNVETGLVTLQPNQAIFLFELGTRTLTSSAADFQDMVVLVTLSRAGGSTTTPGSTTTTPAGSPTLGQRIDLSRLPWLEDRGSHQIKVLFANRTGAPSHLRLDTNIVTLNLANRPVWPGKD